MKSPDVSNSATVQEDPDLQPTNSENFEGTRDQPQTEKTFDVGDWVVVQFHVEGYQGKRNIKIKKYIGKIIELNDVESDVFKITFLRPKTTKMHKGYVYVYPNKADEVECEKEQILYKIEAPEMFERGLKFSVHVTDL